MRVEARDSNRSPLQVPLRSTRRSDVYNRTHGSSKSGAYSGIAFDANGIGTNGIVANGIAANGNRANSANYVSSEKPKSKLCVIS